MRHRVPSARLANLLRRQGLPLANPALPVHSVPVAPHSALLALQALGLPQDKPTSAMTVMWEPTQVQVLRAAKSAK